MYKYVSFENVKINDGFWGKLQKTNKCVTLPVEYERTKATGRLDAFKLLWKPESDTIKPHIYWDSDVAKWIEAAAYSLVTHPDPELESILDEAIEDIINSQQPDGYINSYYTVVEPHNRFTNLHDNHELYCCGHLLEAAIAYYRATGKDAFLNAMRRYADYINQVFGLGEDQIKGYPGHQELELALVKLYELTDDKTYLNLAKYFVDERGSYPNYFELEAQKRGDHRNFNLERQQAHMPVREMVMPVGHAVRAVYLYSAMADIARTDGDEELGDAARRLWDNLTGKFMYITGGIGSTAACEGFIAPYELPNVEAYCETCAAVGLVFFAMRMLALENSAKYGDVLERALYNGVIAGVSVSGDEFFYANPLEVIPYKDPWGIKKEKWYRRSKWFDCACCPSNISRLLASLGSYFLTTSKKTVALHLYDNIEAKLELEGVNINLKVETNYPQDGRVRVQITPEKPLEFDFKFRVPGWCEVCRLDGEIVKPCKDGYITLKKAWDGDVLEIAFEMSPRLVYSSPHIRSNAGTVAIAYGPLIFCVEDTDNEGNIQRLRLPQDATFEIDTEDEVMKLIANAYVATPATDELYSKHDEILKPTQLTAVPYHYWGNRECGGMRVYLPLSRHK